MAKQKYLFPDEINLKMQNFSIDFVEYVVKFIDKLIEKTETFRKKIDNLKKRRMTQEDETHLSQLILESTAELTEQITKLKDMKYRITGDGRPITKEIALKEFESFLQKHNIKYE